MRRRSAAINVRDEAPHHERDDHEHGQRHDVLAQLTTGEPIGGQEGGGQHERRLDGHHHGDEATTEEAGGDHRQDEQQDRDGAGVRSSPKGTSATVIASTPAVPTAKPERAGGADRRGTTPPIMASPRRPGSAPRGGGPGADGGTARGADPGAGPGSRRSAPVRQRAATRAHATRIARPSGSIRRRSRWSWSRKAPDASCSDDQPWPTSSSSATRSSKWSTSTLARRSSMLDKATQWPRNRRRPWASRVGTPVTPADRCRSGETGSHVPVVRREADPLRERVIARRRIGARVEQQQLRHLQALQPLGFRTVGRPAEHHNVLLMPFRSFRRPRAFAARAGHPVLRRMGPPSRAATPSSLRPKPAPAPCGDRHRRRRRCPCRPASGW